MCGHENVQKLFLVGDPSPSHIVFFIHFLDELDHNKHFLKYFLKFV